MGDFGWPSGSRNQGDLSAKFIKMRKDTATDQAFNDDLKAGTFYKTPSNLINTSKNLYGTP
jgi:hypothetical protein